MPRDINGDYSLPLPDVVTGTTIEAQWANDSFDDFATTFQDSLSRSGNGSMLSALKIVDGDKDNPGLAFGSESDTGLYRVPAGSIYFSVLGATYMRITTAGVQVSDDDGATWTEVTGGDYSALENRVTVNEGNITQLQTDVTNLQDAITNITDGSTLYTKLSAQYIDVYDGLAFFCYTPNWSSGTQTVFIDSGNRQYVNVTGALTINIGYTIDPTRVGGDYVLESVILFTNTSGSAITLNVPAAEVLGEPNTAAGSRSLLSCMVFIEGGVELDRVFVWSAEN